MKVVLASLNAKYIHTSLAIRYLREVLPKDIEAEAVDYSINEELQNIIKDIYLRKPDVVGFACYIWNIEQTLKVAQVLKVILPEVKVVFGGPEVSFSAEEYLKKFFYIDAIICGEGERPFKEYVVSHQLGASLEGIRGLAYRIEDIIITNGFAAGANMDDLPFPYTKKDEGEIQNKIIYYESSRGCPFSCSYCLSSATKGMQFLSKKRVEEDLKKIIALEPKQVKFVDRTFNISKEHAMYIWQLILNNYDGKTNFHFELSADLLEDEEIEFLRKFPIGLIQFEIGVQSTDPETCAAINRRTDFEKLSKNVLKLKSLGNIHLHLDLIAGLPEDNMMKFEKSFNDVYALQPDNLQLGFLKVLNGTLIQGQMEKYEIIAQKYPPYEVIKTQGFSFDDILLLKEIEDVLENYYNTMHFKFFLCHLYTKCSEGSFSFYKAFANYLKYYTKYTSFDKKAENLFKFACLNWPELKPLHQEIMLADLLANQKRYSFPEWLGLNDKDLKQSSSALLKDEAYSKNIKYFFALPISKESAAVITGKSQSGILIYDYSANDVISNRIEPQFTQL